MHRRRVFVSGLMVKKIGSILSNNITFVTQNYYKMTLIALNA